MSSVLTLFFWIWSVEKWLSKLDEKFKNVLSLSNNECPGTPFLMRRFC